MSDARIPAIIVTGFLGAGKTTFLNQLLQTPSWSNTAVIVNEFGEIGLDHLLVESAEDDVIELSSGCICCTMRGALEETFEKVLALHDSGKKFDRIVIETTGLADPGPLEQLVLGHPYFCTRLKPGHVITLLDAVNGKAALQRYEEAQKQIALADLILVTKTEMVGAEMVEEGARQLNNRAPMLELPAPKASDKRLPEEVLLHLSSPKELPSEGSALDEHEHHDHDHHHTHRFHSFTLENEAALDLGALDGFLALLSSAHGEKLLRVKGLVKVKTRPEEPMLIHGVQRIFQPPQRLEKWPESHPPRTRLVFITDGLDENLVRSIYDGFSNSLSLDQPDREALMNNPLSIPGL